ncbi:hypothetical protein C8J56DRAFT_1172019 [Mycena floridula]|nr:hypothetical protein C8J56DRAFT_1172019 [Mycena floridula]
MATTPKLSQVFCPVVNCPLAVDIILKSADNVEIGAHRQNLALFSEGFSPSLDAQAPLAIERASYEENSATLRRILDFMHSEIPPDYSDLPFSEARELGRTAHKYIVYQAIPFCDVLMRLHIDRNPLQVLQYALMYNVPRLQNAAFPKTFGCSPGDASRELRLHDAALVGWVKQRQDLRDKVFAIMDRPPIVFHKGGIPTKKCPEWHQFLGVVAQSIFERGALVLSADIENIFDGAKHTLEECQWCIQAVQRWATTQASLGSPRDFIPASTPSSTQAKTAVDLEGSRIQVMSLLANPPVVKHKGGVSRCENWFSFYAQLAAHFFDRGVPESIRHYDDAIRRLRKALDGCFHCDLVLDRWRRQLTSHLT